MTLRLLALAALVAAQTAAPQGSADLDRETAAITAAALDYAEGYYGGEPQRMARALSPLLTKRGLMAPPGMAPFLVQMNADTLIDASHGAKVPPENRHITVEVLDVHGDVASARAFTAQFNDYLHLVKRGGSWQILSVLWHAPPASATPEGAAAAVEQAVRAYLDAVFAKNGPGIAAAVHPVASLRMLGVAPQGRPRVVADQNSESFGAMVAAGRIRWPGTAADAQIVVEGVDVDIASARVLIGPMPIYLHLAMQGGTWRVVNSLGYPQPAG